MKRTKQITALLEAWMIQVLFGRTRRAGEAGSGSLTPTVFSQGFFSWAYAAIAFEGSSPRAFVAGTLSFVVLLSTIALVGELDNERDRPADRDFVRSGPITARTFWIARWLRQAVVTLAYAGGLAIAPAVLAGFKTSSVFFVPLSFILAATVLSSATSAALASATRIIATVAGPDRANSFSSLVRAALLGFGFLAMIVGLRAILSGADAFPGGRRVLEWLPMVHAGDAMLAPGFASIGRALSFPAAVAVLAYLTAAWGARTRATPRSRPRSLLQASLALLVRDRRTHGIASFCLTMLARERSFRLRALPLLGLPFATVVLALRADMDREKLSWLLALVHQLPLAYLPFLLWFVPYAEQSRASWLVQLRVHDTLHGYRRGLELALSIFFVPVQLVIFAVDASMRSANLALWSSLGALGIAWIAMPVLMRELRRPAFSEDPDELQIPTDFGASLAIALCACGAALALDLSYARAGFAPHLTIFLVGLALFTRRARSTKAAKPYQQHT